MSLTWQFLQHNPEAHLAFGFSLHVLVQHLSFRHSWGHMANPCYFIFCTPELLLLLSPFYSGNIQRNKQVKLPPDRCHPETISSPAQPSLGCPRCMGPRCQGLAEHRAGVTWAVPQSHCSPGSTTRFPQTAPLRRDRRLSRGLPNRHPLLPCFRKVSKSLMLQLLKAFTPLKCLKLSNYRLLCYAFTAPLSPQALCKSRAGPGVY